MVWCGGGLQTELGVCVYGIVSICVSLCMRICMYVCMCRHIWARKVELGSQKQTSHYPSPPRNLVTFCPGHLSIPQAASQSDLPAIHPGFVSSCQSIFCRVPVFGLGSWVLGLQSVDFPSFEQQAFAGSETQILGLWEQGTATFD